MNKICFVFALMFVFTSSQAQIIRGYGLKVGTKFQIKNGNIHKNLDYRTRVLIQKIE